MVDVPRPTASPVALRRAIGLTGAVAIVVGGVIGMGIFALVAPMGALAGEALWLAICIAIVLSLASALPLIQLASALPRAGGGYFYVSRMFSPYPGVLTSNWGVLGGAFSSALVAKALAAYVAEQMGCVFPSNLGGALILLLLYALYRLGLRPAIQLQAILVAQLLIALSLYIVRGAAHSGVAMSLAPPRGMGSFFMAVVLAYSLSMGTQVLAEIGEEVRDARRNIPLALFIGGIVVLVFYVAISSVFLSVIPYDYDVYQAMQAPLTQSAAAFLGPYALFFLNIAAIGAGLTSLNAAAGSLPRELFAQARDGILPSWFARIHATGTPMNAVTAYFIVAIALTLSPASVAFCGYMVALGIMMLSIPVSLAALRLRLLYPDRYRAAYVRFPGIVLWTCACISVFCSGGFIVIIALEAPLAPLFYGLWTLFLSVAYVYARRRLERQGVDLARRARMVTGEDEDDERA